MNITNVIAVDLGASSGRLISGSYDGEKITLAEQFRFSNQPIELLDSLYWDYLQILQKIKEGLVCSERTLGKLTSLSVDTWGVDYGLIGINGNLLQAPYSYRDGRATKYLTEFTKKVSAENLFALTGTQLDAIDSIVQLFADLQLNPHLERQIAHVVFMPNLIKYFLSGNLSSEWTITSTSGLLEQKTRKISSVLCEKLGFNKEWFIDFTDNQDLGLLRDKIQTDMNLKSELKILNGVGHDTAAALVSLPVKPDEWQKTAFISCGTWSIVGTQTPEAIVSQEAFSAGLTNEGCQGQKNRLLKNITGLWIVQELQREWATKGDKLSFEEMTALAMEASSIQSKIDPNAQIFTDSGNMQERINEYLKFTQQPLPRDKGELLRLVYESLANSYAKAITELEKITGNEIEDVYMFGGGIQNKLLVDLTRKYTKRNVSLGAVEASVLGNIVDQLEILGKITSANKESVLKKTYEQLVLGK
ncbi:FGGY-family carbohydrate kinase [Ligilactobacillus sp. Marseille-Q7487]|uniref:rhamnulokinase n=1 Tax=Ligilactobacillus sp. Marseille-Q7487 TaxID=3022128 RepID=UPI0024A91F6B|nr:FGGY-family carbohydrate kinase [Ligilactobacillus sp. Marseille-Q7487]